ncbi:MAG: serine hydrolase domain-containing protein [Planctomycetaceae bacterium]
MPTLDPVRWNLACELAADLAKTGALPAVTLATGTANELSGPVSFGFQTVDGTTPLVEEPIYLIASITKPIVATAALLLIERGLITLSDRVSDHLSGFGKQGKYGVEIRHLLTHTSGLPDMLPNNLELRKQNAPLSKFFEEISRLPLSFPVARAVQYQSTGFLVLAEIVKHVTGESCAEFLHHQIFQPLAMRDTALGAPDAWWDGPQAGRIPEIRLPPDQVGAAGWNWNHRYWRQLGAPWGGLLTTAGDLARFAQMTLNDGCTPDGLSLLSPATIAAATTNQLEMLPGIPDEERRCRPWGLGWRLNWIGSGSSFGDTVAAHAYGHWGATGTLLWIDPTRGVFTIVLSTEPYDSSARQLVRLSNAVSAAWR